MKDRQEHVESAQVNEQLLETAVAAYELLKVIHNETGKVGLQLQADIAAAEAQQAEPVAAQCRFEGEEDWKPCTVAHHLLVQAHPKEWPHYETRALYDQPPAALGAIKEQA